MYEFPNKDIKEIQGRNNRSFNKCWINMIFICKKKEVLYYISKLT